MSPLQVVVSQTPSDYGDALGSTSKNSAGTPITPTTDTSATGVDHIEEDLGIDLRRSDSMSQSPASLVDLDMDMASPTAQPMAHRTNGDTNNHTQNQNQVQIDAKAGTSQTSQSQRGTTIATGTLSGVVKSSTNGSDDQKEGDNNHQKQHKKQQSSNSRKSKRTKAVAPPGQLLPSLPPRSETATAKPKSIPRQLDKYGFITNVNSQGHVYDDPNSGQADNAGVPLFMDAKRIARREKKWKQTMASWERRRPKVTLRRLRKGVPDSVRGRVWTKLGGGIKKRGLYDEIIEKTKDVVLENSTSYLASASSLSSSSSSSSHSGTKKPKSKSGRNGKSKNKKKNATKQSDAKDSGTVDPYVNSKAFRDIQNTIERDIHRTYPRHNLFYEDDSSEHEGRPYSSPSSASTPDNPLLHGLRDPEVTAVISNMDGEMNISPSEGLDLSTRASMTIPTFPEGQISLRRVLRAYSYYDREIGYCQGMNFIAGMFLTLMTEEEAFWLLVAVMQNKPCSMRGLFAEGMKETHKVLHVSEMLVQQFLPRLSKHFEREHIHVTMYATQWLLTQYTSSFKFDLVTRIWDCFLCEGWKIIYRVMLALLQQYQSQLLKMSFEEILSFFRELPDRVDGATLMETALKIQLRKQHIEKYEKQWVTQQKQQQQRQSR